VATGLATQGSRTMWHVRGMWSAREDRVPSAVWLGILWVGMIAGFGVDIPGFVRRNPPPPTVMWVHGAVFTVWMLLLTAQVLLVLRDRVAWHRKLGWFPARLRLLLKTAQPVGVLRDKLRQDLYRYVSFQLRVAGTVNLPHSTRT
jgi:hypothetical protein